MTKEVEGALGGFLKKGKRCSSLTRCVFIDPAFLYKQKRAEDPDRLDSDGWDP